MRCRMTLGFSWAFHRRTQAFHGLRLGHSKARQDKDKVHKEVRDHAVSVIAPAAYTILYLLLAR